MVLVYDKIPINGIKICTIKQLMGQETLTEFEASSFFEYCLSLFSMNSFLSHFIVLGRVHGQSVIQKRHT